MLRSINAYNATISALEVNKYISEEESYGELSIDKLSMIWEYLDDIAIQKFFELSLANRPFLIDNHFISNRYTESGKKPIEGTVKLNFADDYDRATFLEWFSVWVFSLPIEEGSAYRNLKKWLIPSVRKDIFGNTILGVGSWLDGDRIPLYSNDEQIAFNEQSSLQQLYLTALYQCDNNRRYLEAYYEFQSCCELFVVPDYTVEDVFFLYCLIAEKLRLSSKNISYIFGGMLSECFLDICNKKKSLPYLFFLYESKLGYIFDYQKDMDKRDLLYRFANKKEGKAFTYYPDQESNTVLISLFHKEEVRTVYCGNTIFLPFHIHSKAGSRLTK